MTPRKATCLSGHRWRTPTPLGELPVTGWLVQDGETTCVAAWPWAAAPTPCPTPAPISLSYFGGMPNGVLRRDDSAVREIEDALRIAERSGDDLAVTNVRMSMGMALALRDTAAERDRGLQLLAEVGDVFVRRGHNMAELPIVNMYLARERALRGGRDDAIPLMRSALDHVFREGRLLWWGPAATGVLVETLLDRGGGNDVVEAEAAIARLADAPADDGLVLRETWLLRMRELLARARRDHAAHKDFVGRYRAMAESLGYEGHLDMAAAMTQELA